MANKFQFDIAAAEAVAAKEVEIKGHKETRSEVTEEINTAKVSQYAQMMAGLRDAPRQKGQLTRPARKSVEDAMDAAGGVDISKGTGKRLYDGAVAMTNPKVYKAALGEDMPTQATAGYFEARLIEAGLTTESKITAAAFPAQSEDAIDQIVRKVVGGYTYRKNDDGTRVPNNWRAGALLDEYDEVIKRLQDAKRISDAVQAEVERVGKDNFDMDAMLASLE